MRAMRHRPRQQGQILVLFTGGLLLLLAIAALVIDIGFVWMIRRQEQNAADPGALAAARYIRVPPPGPDTVRMFRAACFYARENGFFASASSNNNDPTGCVPANDENGAVLEIFYPPSITATGFAGLDKHVEVRISRPHRTFFASVVGLPTIGVASSAVAAWNDHDSNSSSLIALDPHVCPGGEIGGDASVEIRPVGGVQGGYIQINSDCSSGTNAMPDTCENGSAAYKVHGNGSVRAPHTYVRGICAKDGNPIIQPPNSITEGANYVDDPLMGLLPPPQDPAGAWCEPSNYFLQPTGPRSRGCTYGGTGTYVLDPGTYYGGIRVGGGGPTLVFQPGIYIMAGGGLNATRGELSAAAGDMMIFSTDNFNWYGSRCRSLAPNPNDQCQGDISFNGNNLEIDLSGLAVDPCPPVSSTGCPYVGMLFWQDGGASDDDPLIDVEGGVSLYLSGTIYNPDGHVKLNGNGSTTGCSGAGTFQNCAAVQIIANTFSILGTNDLLMPYDPTKLYHLDLRGLVK